MSSLWAFFQNIKLASEALLNHFTIYVHKSTESIFKWWMNVDLDIFQPLPCFVNIWVNTELLVVANEAIFLCCLYNVPFTINSIYYCWYKKSDILKIMNMTERSQYDLWYNGKVVYQKEKFNDMSWFLNASVFTV